jgi:hypothetical protein
MGIDFIRKAAPSYRKGLDRRRVELGTPGLFTRQPDCAPRTFAAKVRDGHALAPGEKLGVCLDGDQVTALRGLDPVAVFTNPSAELRDAISASHGEACGVVREFHDIASIAEITVW